MILWFLAIPLLMLVILSVYAYSAGRRDSVGQDSWMDTPIQVGGNPIFWLMDKFYVAGFYAARKEG